MLEFKTKITTISIDEKVTIERKGNKPLSDGLSWVHLTSWIVDEDEIFLKIGAYSITLKVKSNADMVELIREVFRNPKDMENIVSIQTDRIKIEE